MLQSVADDYFYNINSLTKRIGQEIASTKEAYEGLWNTLSVKEQNQAIDETIIQPDVALKYTIKKFDHCKELPDYYPKLKVQTGTKYVIDESGSTLRWKDEHSAPFSFMTQSQMNLSIFNNSEESQGLSLNNYFVESPRFSNSLQIQQINEVSKDRYDLRSFQSQNHSDTIFFKEECELNDIKKQHLLDTPGSYESFESLSTNKETEIPKTGFEFLDNW